MNRLVTAALVGTVMLGLRDAFRPKDPVPVVVDHAGDPPGLEPITLFFHPEVPEATLVLIR
ncbi:MAG TPA: hypothetical protein VF045_06175 [Acidimicrobiales bacterium]